MRKISSAAILVLLAAFPLPSQTQPPQPPMGFTAARGESELAVEKKMENALSPDKAREFHRTLTSEPHPAGSTRNNELARWVADTWKQQGLEDVQIHRYDVLNSYPRQVVVEMVSPVKYQAGLREAAYDVDPDTKNPRVHSGYLSMSASGEVTAPIVYAHSGNPDDYALLRKNGIDVKGKVVLVRYSNPYSYRGFKALTAQREGAAAMIVYSDPAEDGFKKGAVFPDGPWGPETHIQRGAITYDFIVPGDPLTPGWASVEGAKRIPISEAQSLPKIMALAMSWHDAKPLLENMGGPVAPKDWQGGLPIQYRLGGTGRVHVKIDMDNSVLPNYVVEARIRGSEFPDEWVLLGNHRDAWEFGGVDPSSGTASMLELSGVLGDMLKQGARPRRTLVFCSWDGEEIGLTGSTEWGEQFADELKKKLVAYLNVDSSTSGQNLEVSAVGSLAPMLVQATKGLSSPAGGSLHDVWMKTLASERTTSKDTRPINDANLVDTRIGSGSDHTVFLNFLGRPTVGLTFTGPYGVYHSMYDDFFWMNHFGDPGYRYHIALAQLWGVTALRLGNSDLLPFDFASYAENVRQFVNELQTKNPEAKDHLDFSKVLTGIAEFEAAGMELNGAMQAALEGKLAPGAAAKVNAGIMQVESNWLNPDGIPGRPWFKHVLYAARYTYAHLELPGVTEAVEKKDWKTAEQQMAILEQALVKNAQLVKGISGELTGAPPGK